MLVDGDGCYGYEDVDDDGDGILDVNDFCPVQAAPEGNSVLQSNGCYDVAGDTGLDSDQGVSGSGLDFDRLDVIIGGLGLIASILGAFGILLKHVILCLGEGTGVHEVPQSGLQCADLVQIRHGRDFGLKLNVGTVSHGPSQKDAERKEAQLKGHGRSGQP